jgi:hypothetical protein
MLSRPPPPFGSASDDRSQCDEGKCLNKPACDSEVATVVNVPAAATELTYYLIIETLPFTIRRARAVPEIVRAEQSGM